MGFFAKIGARLRGSQHLSTALSGKTWRLNPQRETLFNFNKASDVEKFEMFTDNEVGGKSTGFFTLSDDRRFATLHGNLSLQLPQEPFNGTMVTKTGMVAIRSEVPFAIPQGSEYDSFVLTARGDGRKFLINATIINNTNKKEILQAAFESPTEWSDIIIPFRAFVPCWRNDGTVSFANRGLDLSSMDLTHVGIMMSERKEGPFKLELVQMDIVDSKKKEKRKFSFDS